MHCSNVEISSSVRNEKYLIKGEGMKKKNVAASLIFGLIVTLVLPMVVFASGPAIDPKGNIVAPRGTNVVVWYYRHIFANEYYVNGEKVSQDSDYSADIGMFRACHYGELFETKIPYCANIIIPFGSQNMEMGAVDSRASGIGDSILSFTTWWLNKKNIWGDFVMTMITPTGEYDEAKALNMGANRWSPRCELGITWIPVDRWTVDLHGAVQFYTTNTEYGADHKSLDKDPEYTFQTCLSYDLVPSKLFVSGTYYWNKGGETEIDGMAQDNETDTHGAMLTTGIMLKENIQLLVQYLQDIEVENGLDTSSFRLRLAYYF